MCLCKSKPSCFPQRWRIGARRGEQQWLAVFQRLSPAFFSRAALARIQPIAAAQRLVCCSALCKPLSCKHAFFLAMLFPQWAHGERTLQC